MRLILLQHYSKPRLFERLKAGMLHAYRGNQRQSSLAKRLGEIMAIQHSKQSWQVGSTVKVGFLTLRVVALIPTPGDSMPDIYRLESLDSSKQYEFRPHYGLERLD